MKRSALADRYCSIARAGALLVDAWSLMILKEVFLSNTRFDGLRSQTGMSPRSLTLRLNALVDDGILERVAYQQSPERFEYRPSAKGIELWPVVVSLKVWGDKWTGPWHDQDPPLILQHKGQGHRLELGVVCKACGQPVDARSSQVVLTHAMCEERDRLAAEHEDAVRASRPAMRRERTPTKAGP